MSYNIILNNFNENDFISKGAKANIKKFIKKNVSLENVDNLDSHKNEIIAKYLKINKDHIFNISHKLIDDDLNLYLNSRTLDEIKKDEQRKIIQKKIDDLNKPKLTQRQVDKIKKKSVKEIKDNDDRISNNMVNAYCKAVEVLEKAPKPKEVLDNKAKYIDEIFKHLLFISKKSDSIEALHEHMNNSYINYLQLVCQINYKSYLDVFFKKIYEQTDINSNIPELIKSEYLKKYGEKKVITQNIIDKMVDSDED